MPIIRHTNAPDAVWTRRPDHDVHDYEKIDLVSRAEAKGCVAALIKLPPKKAGFPYHYHTINEECFFILSGKGLLRTPEGEQEVAAGTPSFSRPAKRARTSSRTSPNRAAPLPRLRHVPLSRGLLLPRHAKGRHLRRKPATDLLHERPNDLLKQCSFSYEKTICDPSVRLRSCFACSGVHSGTDTKSIHLCRPPRPQPRGCRRAYKLSNRRHRRAIFYKGRNRSGTEKGHTGLYLSQHWVNRNIP